MGKQTIKNSIIVQHVLITIMIAFVQITHRMIRTANLGKLTTFVNCVVRFSIYSYKSKIYRFY